MIYKGRIGGWAWYLGCQTQPGHTSIMWYVALLVVVAYVWITLWVAFNDDILL